MRSQPLSLIPLLLGWSVLIAGCGGEPFDPAVVDPGGGDASLEADAEAGTGTDARPDADSAVPDAPWDGTPDGAAEAGPEAGEEAGAEAGAEAEADVPLRELGEPCFSATQCASDQCWDGVCCDQVCEGCSTCVLSGAAGTCVPVPLGSDPHDTCGGAGNLACVGACDGAGACSFPQGAPCAPPVCGPSATSVYEYPCDASGGCQETLRSCDGYLCREVAGQAACLTACDNGSDCAPGWWCDDSACKLKSESGTTCNAAQECASDFCADGVCCSDPCSETCESCALAGSEGSCSPIPSGQDPAGECTNGSTSTTCIGACSGNRSCSFPSSTVTCGATYCDVANNAQRDPRCDGTGWCVDMPRSCGLYLCDPAAGACPADCLDDAGCTATAWCKNGVCTEKSHNGLPCGSPNQCSSGYCTPNTTSPGATCCESACPAPMDCSTGQCLCSGVTCAQGVQCVAWYRDSDGDGFGNPLQAAAGCKDIQPQGYVGNADDCYDFNPNARPDQTDFFPTHRGDYSFDYNCDGVVDKFFTDNLTTAQKVCVDCRKQVLAVCAGCGGMGAGFATYGYLCDPCGARVKEAFFSAVACGQIGTVNACNKDAPNNICSNQSSQRQEAQRCR